MVYTGDQDVQKKGFDQNSYRNQIADMLNKSEKLKQKLSEIKEQLHGQNLYKESMVIVINGPDFSNGNPTLRLDFSDTNPDVTGIIDNSSTIQNWYVINDDDSKELVRLRSEQEPKLLPPLLVQNGKYIRTDSREEVMMRGYHYGTDQKTWFAVEPELTQAKYEGGVNFIAFDLDINTINNKISMQKLAKYLAYVRNRLGFRIVVTTGWKGDDALQVDDTIADNWRSLLEFQDQNNIFLNGNNFGALAQRAIDICSLRSEPNDKSTVFNLNYKTAADEVRRILGNNTIIGLTPGNWFGDSPPDRAIAS